jgi:glycolate oxidase
MHPIILFNPRIPGDLEKARAAGEEILNIAFEAGGSITGEHGVGMEKNELMAKQFTPESLEMMRKLKVLFDPDGIA